MLDIDLNRIKELDGFAKGRPLNEEEARELKKLRDAEATEQVAAKAAQPKVKAK